MSDTPVEVQFTSAGCLNYPCRTPLLTVLTQIQPFFLRAARKPLDARHAVKQQADDAVGSRSCRDRPSLTTLSAYRHRKSQLTHVPLRIKISRIRFAQSAYCSRCPYEDAADKNAIGDHIEAVFVPANRRPPGISWDITWPKVAAEAEEVLAASGEGLWLRRHAAARPDSRS
jgi:hypothetical protein